MRKLTQRRLSNFPRGMWSKRGRSGFWNQVASMAPHSSTLAWKIPWMEEPGRLQSMLRVGHDWATSLSLFTFMHWRRKWQPTPVFLPGESQGRGEPGGLPSMGSHRVGHDWSNLAEQREIPFRHKLWTFWLLTYSFKKSKTNSLFSQKKCCGHTHSDLKSQWGLPDTSVQRQPASTWSLHSLFFSSRPVRITVNNFSLRRSHTPQLTLP